LRIGIIGTGRMGSALAEYLAEKNIELVVYNRTRAKAEELCGRIECSVVEAPSNMEDVDAIIIFVFDDNSLLEIVGGEHGLLQLRNKDILIMNSTTITPTTSLYVYNILKNAGLHYVESPVYGSRDQARTGKLITILAGDEDDLDTAEKIASLYSQEVFRVGLVPTASAIKLALNNIGLVMPALIGESLAILEAYGIEHEKFLRISSKLWFGEAVKKYYLRAMNERQESKFSVAGAAKDYSLIARALHDAGYVAVVSSGLANYYKAAAEEMPEEDYPKAMRLLIKE